MEGTQGMKWKTLVLSLAFLAVAGCESDTATLDQLQLDVATARLAELSYRRKLESVNAEIDSIIRLSDPDRTAVQLLQRRQSALSDSLRAAWLEVDQAKRTLDGFVNR
jgi:hypothetical protein